LKDPPVPRYLKHELIFTTSQGIIRTKCKENYDLPKKKKKARNLITPKKKREPKKEKNFMNHRPNIW
jgi:hypothetical protein